MKWDLGFHAPADRRVDASAYEQYVGRWSRLFVPSILSAAELRKGDRVLDVATGSGEAAQSALAAVGNSGLVIGTDIAPGMLAAALTRLSDPRFHAAAMNGQSLAFRDAAFDVVLCQLGLMFFADPTRGLAEFHRVLRPGRCAAVCVISTSGRAPIWGILADTLSRFLPEQAQTLQLSFALADVARLEGMFRSAGFRDIKVIKETHAAIVGSFDEYWAPIEAGTGLMPQAYRALSAPLRGLVREEVRACLGSFESEGRYEMGVEMIIGAGRA